MHVITNIGHRAELALFSDPEAVHGDGLAGCPFKHTAVAPSTQPPVHLPYPPAGSV